MPFCRAILLFALIVAGSPAAAFQNFSVSSGSMLPALDAGDVVTVAFYGVDYNALAKGRTLDEAKSDAPAFQPQRGDIAAFQPQGRSPYIKRIVGLPGDRVQMRHGRLFLNDAEVETTEVAPILDTCREGATCRYLRETLPEGRSYVVIDSVEESGGDETPDFKVPADSYFVLGDDRDHSIDSRFGPRGSDDLGMIPRAELIGRVVKILVSKRAEPSVEQRLGGFPNAR